MKKFPRSEYPLVQHASITIFGILTFVALALTLLFFVPFILFIIGGIKHNGGIIWSGIGSAVALPGFITLLVLTVKRLKTTLAANDKVIVILHQGDYLEFSINRLHRYILTYTYEKTDDMQEHFNNYGQIKIFIDGDMSYEVKCNNLNKTAKYLEKFTGKKAEKIKKSPYSR